MPPPNPATAHWFSAHVQPHEEALRAYLRGLVHPSDVDDLVQETYARGSIEHPRGLLFAAARNAARDLFRRP